MGARAEAQQGRPAWSPACQTEQRHPAVGRGCCLLQGPLLEPRTATICLLISRIATHRPGNAKDSCQPVTESSSCMCFLPHWGHICGRCRAPWGVQGACQGSPVTLLELPERSGHCWGWRETKKVRGSQPVGALVVSSPCFLSAPAECRLSFSAFGLSHSRPGCGSVKVGPAPAGLLSPQRQFAGGGWGMAASTPLHCLRGHWADRLCP